MTQTTVTASVTRTKIWPLPKEWPSSMPVFRSDHGNTGRFRKQRRFPGSFYFCCIEHGHAAAKSGEHHPHHHTETCAGEDVNAGDSLCDSDRERVHPGGSEADLCCDVRDKHGNDRVVSDSDEQRAEDHGERKGLFSHSEHGSAEENRTKRTGISSFSAPLLYGSGRSDRLQRLRCGS